MSSSNSATSSVKHSVMTSSDSAAAPVKHSTEWIYTLIIVPTLLFILPYDYFLFTQSIYYFCTFFDDPIHHVVACIYLGSAAFSAIADNQLTAVVTCIGEMLIGAMLCPFIPKSISVPFLLICRLIIHPFIIWMYVLDPFTRLIHMFFLSVAVWKTSSHIAKKLRSGPFVLVWLRGLLAGVRTAYVDDVKLAKSIIIQSTAKGSFIEDVVSSTAWQPLRSIESVDGDEWIYLKSQFTSFMTTLPELDVLRKIVAEEARAVESSQIIIDSPAICKLIATTFLRYILHSRSIATCEDVVDAKSISNVVDDIVLASNEWRKEIALSGFSNRAIKQKAIDSLSSFLNVDSRDIDHIMQPFFISPIINLSDIMCAIEYEPDISPDDLVLQAIMRQHPFPFLERYVNTQVMSIPAKTQVYMPFAEMAAANPNEQWMCFSVGRRGCPGKHIAMVIATELVRTLAPLTRFQPHLHHQYSGRQNDKHMNNGWHALHTMVRAVIAPYRKQEH